MATRDDDRDEPEKLAEWRDTLGPLLDGLYDAYLTDSAAGDFSAEVLDELEEAILDETRPGATPAPGLARSVHGFLGEMIISTGGGEWSWDGATNRPVAILDPALNCAIDPDVLIKEAFTVRSGQIWSGALQRLERAVSEQHRENPDWAPTRLDDAAITEVTYSTAERHPWLTQWLAERERKFTAWAKDTSRPAATWEFTPESLDVLEDLVRSRAADEDDLARPELMAFVEGAEWYVGEMLRRHREAHWTYHAPESGPSGGGAEDNPFVGRPFVAKDPPSTLATVPLVEIEAVLWEDGTGLLRTAFEEFRD